MQRAATLTDLAARTLDRSHAILILNVTKYQNGGRFDPIDRVTTNDTEQPT